jgi:hypothetical protein
MWHLKAPHWHVYNWRAVDLHVLLGYVVVTNADTGEGDHLSNDTQACRPV